MNPRYFATSALFRQWIEKHHATKTELIVGYYKKASNIPSMTWSESVDEALCFGWIDGVRNAIDDKSYQIRFTPRRSNSMWSDVNLKKMEILTKQGLVTPAGVAMFDQRNEQSGLAVILDTEYEAVIRANTKAWLYFESLAPSYKKGTIFWIMSAKRKATREKRLSITIESSEAGLKVPHFRR